jgi:flavorubredoxin
MPHVSEIAPDLYRISIYVSEYNLQFNHFLIKDDEPLLFHTGLRRMFPEVRDGVAKVLDPARIRCISFSHLEPDECGALNQWLAAAPDAQVVTGLVGGMMMNDFADRPPARAISRPNSYHRQVPLSLSPYTTASARLGCWRDV